MNTILKYFLYFLFGYIIYLLLNYKKIEGFGIELNVLSNILKEQSNLGCSNFVCEKDPYYINPYSLWRTKTDIKDENFYLCNNSPEYSIASSLNAGNKCNKELCCEDRSCSHKFFNKGYHCINRLKLYNNECPIGIDSEDCSEYCCGIQLEGPGEILYDSVRRFKEQIYSNSSTPVCTGGDLNLESYNPDDNPNTVSLLDIRNYKYFNTLDLENMTISNLTNTTLETITYCDFEKIQVYLTNLYNEIISGASTDTEKVNNFKNTPLLNDNTRIKIKDNYINDDMNVSQYVNRLTDNSETENILSQRIYGMVSKAEIQDKYTNFLRNYTNYDDTETYNTHDELIKSIKLTMLLLGNPSLYSSDRGRTPMDSLLSLESGDYYRTNISSTDLQIIL